MEQNNPQSEQVANITSYVLNDFLGIQLTPSETSNDFPGERMESRIFITGAWDGSVSLLCSENLSQRITSGMFRLPSESVSMDDIQDALGELVNILGGNIKPLFPAPSSLSLPFYGGDPEPGSLLCQIDMNDEEGKCFRLQVMQYEDR